MGSDAEPEGGVDSQNGIPVAALNADETGNPGQPYKKGRGFRATGWPYVARAVLFDASHQHASHSPA